MLNVYIDEKRKKKLFDCNFHILGINQKIKVLSFILKNSR